MTAASVLVKPASSACNISCSYCFYRRLCENREVADAGRMSPATLEALVTCALSYGDELVSLCFQGGEPTLAGLDYFREAVRLEKKLARPGQTVENTLQTNGMLIDDDWARFLAEEDFLVGISLDGPAAVHDAHRRDAAGRGTHARVMQSLELLRRHGVRTNVLCVVGDEAAADARGLWEFWREAGLEWVQVIACMGEERGEEGDAGAGLDRRGRKREFPAHEKGGAAGEGEQRASTRGAVSPVAWGEFLAELFDLWYAAWMAGTDIDIRIFSNFAALAAGYPAEECGMSGRCTPTAVVEGDGSVYPCDFYCTDQWRLGNVREAASTPGGLGALLTSERARDFAAPSFDVCGECRECQWLALCRGGCRRWREAGGGKDALCEGWKIFFEHAWERLHILGQMIIERYGRP